MKKILILGAAVAMLSGCALTGGQTEYELEPLVVDGQVVCCKATINNSKDYKKLKFKLEKNADGSVSVSLDEEGVSASDPAAIAADNNAKLLDAVTQLIPIVKPGGGG